MSAPDTLNALALAVQMLEAIARGETFNARDYLERVALYRRVLDDATKAAQPRSEGRAALALALPYDGA
jgi:hypothetical protein